MAFLQKPLYLSSLTVLPNLAPSAVRALGLTPPGAGLQDVSLLGPCRTSLHRAVIGNTPWPSGSYTSIMGPLSLLIDNNVMFMDMS